LQQLLRTPAQAAVNIIEKEDVTTMQDAAKYDGMRSEIGRLRADLELKLARMIASTANTVSNSTR